MGHTKETVSLIQTHYDLEDREIVCYPYLIITFRIDMPRLFMKPRTVYTVVTADLVKGVVARSNLFPESNEIEIENSALVPSMITHEEALGKARKLALKWVMYKFHIFRTPAIEAVEVKAAYKAFFHFDTGDKKVLVDSVKGLEADDVR